AGGAGGPTAVPAPAHAGRATSLGRRGAGQPACGFGPAACGGTGPGRWGQPGDGPPGSEGRRAMSQTAIAGRISTRPALRAPVRPQPAAPRLRVVAPPARGRARAGVTVLCLVLLAGGLVGLLVLNINLSHGSYTLHDLQQQQTALQQQQE